MVGLIAEPVDVNQLATTVKNEVASYAGYSPLARVLPVLDDQRQTYAIVIIEHDPAARPAYIMVMARVVDEWIIIEEDRSFDKPLVEALMHNAGIPRERIILAYAGETLPEAHSGEPRA